MHGSLCICSWKHPPASVTLVAQESASRRHCWCASSRVAVLSRNFRFLTQSRGGPRKSDHGNPPSKNRYPHMSHMVARFRGCFQTAGFGLMDVLCTPLTWHPVGICVPSPLSGLHFPIPSQSQQEASQLSVQLQNAMAPEEDGQSRKTRAAKPSTLALLSHAEALAP